MYFIHRALKYLRKKLGKTIFMAVIFFIIANFVLAGLLIQQASQLAEKNARLAIGTDVYFIPNWGGLIDDNEKGLLPERVFELIKDGGVLTGEIFTENGAPTPANLKILSQLDQVDFYRASRGQIAEASDYSQVQVEQETSDTGRFFVSMFDGSQPASFDTGEEIMVEGRMLSEEEMANGGRVILIEERFADLNRLAVGDSLELIYPEVSGQSYKVDHEIVGIYSSEVDVSGDALRSGDPTLFVANKFYVPLSMMTAIGYSQSEADHLFLLDNAIRLRDPERKNEFEEEVNDILNLRYGELDANDDIYETVTGPLETVGLISNLAIGIILVTGGLIIGLITALTVNERRSEVGILLAIGERKAKIVMQFVMEVLIIAVVTFALSIISGNLIGQVISDSPITAEFIQTDDLEYYGTKGGKGYTEMDIDQPELMVSLNLQVVATLFGVGILLSVISTIIPSLYVMRYNPKQILSSKVS